MRSILSNLVINKCFYQINQNNTSVKPKCSIHKIGGKLMKRRRKERFQKELQFYILKSYIPKSKNYKKITFKFHAYF